MTGNEPMWRHDFRKFRMITAYKSAVTDCLERENYNVSDRRSLFKISLQKDELCWGLLHYLIRQSASLKLNYKDKKDFQPL